jgi:hypothetical protein
MFRGTSIAPFLFFSSSGVDTVPLSVPISGFSKLLLQLHDDVELGRRMSSGATRDPLLTKKPRIFFKDLLISNKMNIHSFIELKSADFTVAVASLPSSESAKNTTESKWLLRLQNAIFILFNSAGA